MPRTRGARSAPYRSNEELKANAIDRGFVWTREHIETQLKERRHASDGAALIGSRWALFDERRARWILYRQAWETPDGWAHSSVVGNINGRPDGDVVIARVALWILGEGEAE